MLPMDEEQRAETTRSPCSPQSAEGMEYTDTLSPSHVENIAPTSLLVSVVKAMIKQETDYRYGRYRPDGCVSNSIKDKWRQDICHWVRRITFLF